MSDSTAKLAAEVAAESGENKVVDTLLSKPVKLKYNRSAKLGAQFLGEGYEEPVYTREFDKSVTDPTYYKSNAQLITEFMASGQVLSSARLQQYDFQDGEDDGSDYPISRHISATPEEVYQSMQDTLSRVRLRDEYRRVERSKREERQESLTEIKNALQSLSRASESKIDSPADKLTHSFTVSQPPAES